MRNIHVRTTFPLYRSSWHMVNFFQYGTYNLIPAWTLLGGSATFTICSTTVCLCKSEFFFFWAFIGGNPNNYMHVNRLFLQHIPSLLLLAVSFLFLCATRSTQTTRRHYGKLLLSSSHPFILYKHVCIVIKVMYCIHTYILYII